MKASDWIALGGVVLLAILLRARNFLRRHTARLAAEYGRMVTAFEARSSRVMFLKRTPGHAPNMIPVEAEAILQLAAECFPAGTIERDFMDRMSQLLLAYRSLIETYSDFEVSPEARRAISDSLADFLAYWSFKITCSETQRRGRLNNVFAQALAVKVGFELSGRHPAQPEDEDFRTLSTWRFAGMDKYEGFWERCTEKRDFKRVEAFLLSEEIAAILAGEMPLVSSVCRIYTFLTMLLETEVVDAFGVIMLRKRSKLTDRGREELLAGLNKLLRQFDRQTAGLPPI